MEMVEVLFHNAEISNYLYLLIYTVSYISRISLCFLQIENIVWGPRIFAGYHRFI